MLIHEKYKNIQKKGFNPPYKGINPEKWPKIRISRISRMVIFMNAQEKYNISTRQEIFYKHTDTQLVFIRILHGNEYLVYKRVIQVHLCSSRVSKILFFGGFEVPKKRTLQKKFSHLNFCQFFFYRMKVHSMYLISPRGIFDVCPVRTSRQIYF